MRGSDSHKWMLAMALGLLGMLVATGPAGAAPSRSKRRPQMHVHVVEEGEAVWTIARAYGVSMDELLNDNPDVDPEKVRPGDELRVRGAARKPSRARRGHRSHRNAAAQRAERRAERLGLGTLKAARSLLTGRAESSWIAAAGSTSKLPGSLRWPVTKGWFVRGFGSGAGGYHQAVDVGGEVGWNVRAAAPGLVAYAGHGLNGFGNVVILVHPGGWITLYGHNSKNHVVAGQDVRRGQVLGEVGSTGKSKGPHVHFELLFEGENCDPASLFRPGMRERDGGLRNVHRRFWSRPGRKPRAIQCHPRKHHPGHRS